MSISPGGTTAGSEQLLRFAARLAGEETDGGRRRRPCRLRRLYRRHVRRPHRRPGHLAGRLDRRVVPVSEFHPGAQDHRHPGRGDQILAAQGRAQRLRADQPGGARGDRRDRLGFLRLVQRPGEEPPPTRRCPARRASPTAASSPAARASASSWSTRSATKRPRWPGWREEKSIPADTPVRDYSLATAVRRVFLPPRRGLRRFQAMGLSAVAQRIEDWGAVQAVERLNLDGLLALWHPPSAN